LEAEEHYYNPDHEKLKKLGFKPTMKLEEELDIMLDDLMRYRDRIRAKSNAIYPTITWRAKAGAPTIREVRVGYGSH
jgi:hypothetical protein